MSQVNFTIGCDPELFVRSNETGKNVAAVGLVPGDKENPYVVSGGAVQVDGLALEFNAGPFPASDFKAFDDGVLGVMRTMRDMVKAKDPTLGFDIVPSVEFEKSYYDSLPESAKELGCDPDFCAYSKNPFEPNPRPSGDSGLRGAGGHIHIGWGADIPTDNEDHMEICRAFIRNADIFVGLGMLIIDTDERRRTVYGKAGAFRPKSYGVEYRTPSNAWLKSPATRRFIHGLVNSTLTDMQKGDGAACMRTGRKGSKAGRIDAQSIINGGDIKAAYDTLISLGVRVPNDLRDANPKLVEALGSEALANA